jgi:hypothetical protein
LFGRRILVWRDRIEEVVADGLICIGRCRVDLPIVEHARGEQNYYNILGSAVSVPPLERESAHKGIFIYQFHIVQ